MVGQTDAVALADAQSGCAPLAHTIQSHNRRLLERAGEKRTGGMAFMVIGEDQASVGRSSQSSAQRSA